MHETPDFLCSRHCGCGRCGEIKCPICIEPLSPMKFLDALLRSAASRSRQVFVPYSNILHVLGGFPLIRSKVMSTSVHEKALLEPAENYRPISLLPIVSKVTERCACKRLYYHVQQSITSLQHRFMCSPSCSSQLLSVLHSIWGGT